jgi:tRNA(Arg) A34 adenosine deaminase TadA
VNVAVNDTDITLGRTLRSIPGMHAEIAVLYKLGILTDKIFIKILKGVSFKLSSRLPSKKIKVIRILKDLTLADATPCAMCRKVLLSLGFTKVYYSNSEGKIVCKHPRDIVSSVSVGVELEKCHVGPYDIIHCIRR